MAPNFKPHTIWTGDNLPILRGLDSGSVDLIYADPPFNSKKNYSAPIGSQAAGAAFKDTWALSDVDRAWIGEIRGLNPALHAAVESAGKIAGPGMQSYLTMMGVRLLEMRRVLKSTGSLYLHCDPTANAYLRTLLDAIFGAARFQNEIVWKRQSSHNRAKRWGPVHDTILFYAGVSYTWNRVLQPLDTDYVERFYRHTDNHGRYRASDLTGPGLRDGDTGQPWRGIDPSDRSRHWELPPDRALPNWFEFPEGYADMPARKRLDILDAQALIYWPTKGKMPAFKRYLTSKSGAPSTDMVLDIPPLSHNAKERVGYPTQKPLALLRRIILASSNRGDIVLDQFAGCATALVAAQEQGREWLGIDISPVAVRLVKERIRVELGALNLEIVERTDVPRRLGKRSRNIRQTLYGRQGGDCNLCEQHFHARNLTLDHVIPRAHGGPDDDANLQLLCGACNSLKGTGTMTEALARFTQREKTR